MRPVCLVCGSVDIVMDGGLFVCQDCGARYSVEQMRDIMSNNPQADESANKAPTPKPDFSIGKEALDIAGPNKWNEGSRVARMAISANSNDPYARVTLILCDCSIPAKEPPKDWDQTDSATKLASVFRDAYQLIDGDEYIALAKKTLFRFAGLRMLRHAAVDAFLDMFERTNGESALDEEGRNRLDSMRAERREPPKSMVILFTGIVESVVPFDEKIINELDNLVDEPFVPANMQHFNRFRHVDNGHYLVDSMRYWKDNWSERENYKDLLGRAKENLTRAVATKRTFLVVKKGLQEQRNDIENRYAEGISLLKAKADRRISEVKPVAFGLFSSREKRLEVQAKIQNVKDCLDREIDEANRHKAAELEEIERKLEENLRQVGDAEKIADTSRKEISNLQQKIYYPTMPK